MATSQVVITQTTSITTPNRRILQPLPPTRTLFPVGIAKTSRSIAKETLDKLEPVVKPNSDECDVLKLENAKLKSMCETHIQKLETLKKSYETLRAEYQKNQTRYSKLENKLFASENAAKKLQDDFDNERTEYDRTLNKLQVTNLDLQKHQDELEKTINMLRKKLDTHSGGQLATSLECQRLKEALAEAKAEKDKAFQDAYNIAYEAASKQIDEVVSKFKQEVIESSQKYTAGNKERYEKEKTELISKTDAKIKQTEDACSKEIRSLQEKIETLTNEHKAALAFEVAQNQNLKTVINENRTQLLNLITELKEAKLNIEKFKVDFRTQTLQEFQTIWTDAEGHLAKVEKEKDTARSTITQMQVDLDTARAETEKYRLAAENAEKGKTEALLSATKAREQLESTKSETLKFTSNFIAEAQKQVAACQTVNTSVQVALTGQQTEINYLRFQLFNTEKRLAESQRPIDDFR
jgi:chromosome segregation ATPase